MSQATLATLVDSGAIIAIPGDYAVDDHPGTSGPTAYLAAEPLRLAASDGSTRQLHPGDLLHADEARHAGTALSRMISLHSIIAVPADRGIVGAVAALLERIDRLERLTAKLYTAGTPS